MTVTQTVDIPANRRITIEVPSQIPIGKTKVILQFPVMEKSQLDDVYAGIPSKLDDDLLNSQLDILEKVEW